MNYPHFYVLQPRWSGADRFYKIFVTKDLLCGAKLAGQFYDKGSAYRQLVYPAQIFAPLMAIWANRLVKMREETERTYENIGPTTSLFMSQDKHNFQIALMQIENIVFITRRTLWSPDNFGKMEVYLRGEKKMTFLLIGNDAEQVETLLKPFSVQTQIKRLA